MEILGGMGFMCKEVELSMMVQHKLKCTPNETCALCVSKTRLS